MKVGILGSGEVAKALASGFLKHGHEVTLGTREPAKLVEWKTKNPKGEIGGFADAAKFGELVVLAVKGSVSAEALRAGHLCQRLGRLRSACRTPEPCSGVTPRPCRENSPSTDKEIRHRSSQLKST